MNGGVTDMLRDLLKLREIICLSRINNTSGALPYECFQMKWELLTHGVQSRLG
jgi:hypothetical protein